MIIDFHTHLMHGISERTEKHMAIARRFGITRLCTCMGREWQDHPTEAQIREANDYVLSLMRHWPETVTGYCYLNPTLKKSLEEFDRCIDAGMKGVKLWVAVQCSNPCVFPVIEKAAEMKIPILQHAYLKTTGNRKGESTPADVAEAAARYPEARFVMAHAGGNWEIGIRTIKDCPNVSIDTGGFDPTPGFLEMALRELGPDRILFGSDATTRSFASQLAKIDSVKLPERTRNKILFRNARSLLGL